MKSAANCFEGVSIAENIRIDDFPKVSDYSTIKRPEYEDAIIFSKYILFGFDPSKGAEPSFFPEFMYDMNVIFELYVMCGLQRIFIDGFGVKQQFTLGLTSDIPLEKKYIELDVLYQSGDRYVVIDTKNKYSNVIDREIQDFVASNPDLYQQYYYAARLNTSHIVLVYPSNRKKTSPIGSYSMDFDGCKNINV